MIAHRYLVHCNVTTAFAKLSDPLFLDARSLAIGELDSHSTTERQGDQTIIHMTRRFVRSNVPKAVGKLFNSEQTVEFVEQWRPEGDAMMGHYTSVIIGMPVTLYADIELRPKASESEYLIKLRPQVRIPLIGSLVERYILGQSLDGIGAEIDYLNATLPQQENRSNCGQAPK